METATLVAGFGRSDITPHPNYPSGMWMAQTHTRAAGVHRSLYANCLALGTGEERVLLLSYDLCILSPRQTAAIRTDVSAATGVSADRIWLYCTHTHAGPVTQDFYDREGADEVREYVEALPQRSAEAAERALASTRAARARGGSGTCSIGVNRDLLHEGRIVTGPNPAGVVDPRVDVLRVDAVDGGAIAAIVTYGSHPTYLGPGNELVSPDYAGVTRDVVEELVGAPSCSCSPAPATSALSAASRARPSSQSATAPSSPAKPPGSSSRSTPPTTRRSSPRCSNPVRRSES